MDDNLEKIQETEIKETKPKKERRTKKIEKGIAINATAIQFYHTEIEPILNSKSELLNDYRNLAGNVFNFETVFRDNMFNYEMTEEFQKKHFAIIEEYRKIYESGFEKWKLKFQDIEKR